MYKRQVDGLIIPDLPFEEQDDLQNSLEGKDETILIQLVSPVSKDKMCIRDRCTGGCYSGTEYKGCK